MDIEQPLWHGSRTPLPTPHAECARKADYWQWLDAHGDRIDAWVSTHPGLVLSHDLEGHAWVELHSAIDADFEALGMRHSIGHSWTRYQGRGPVYSLRRDGVPQLTVLVSDNVIVHAREAANARPSRANRRMLSNFAHEMGLGIRADTRPFDLFEDVPASNTMVRYLYRDELNNKRSHQVVVSGCIDTAAVDALVESLPEGMRFDPGWIGAPLLGPRAARHELDDMVPDHELATLAPTSDVPDLDIDAGRFVAALCRGGRERDPRRRLDSLSTGLARIVAGHVRTPAHNAALRHELRGMDAQRMLRCVQAGPVEVVVMAVSPYCGPGAAASTSSAPQAGRCIARCLELVCSPASACLPATAGGRIGIIQLEAGWVDADTMASCIELDTALVPKYVLRPGEDLAALCSRVPALAQLWSPGSAAGSSWLSRIWSHAGLGNLGRVELELLPGPGVTILLGGPDTGKTLLLSTLQRSLSGEKGRLELSFSGPVPDEPGICLVRQHRLCPSSVEVDAGLRAYRRLMGYGRPNGELYASIQMESELCQSLERIGQVLLACANHPTGVSSWPGLVLDVALNGIDEPRRLRLLQTIARLSQVRQVIASSRDPHEAQAWVDICRSWGVNCDVVDLRGNTAVLTREIDDPELVPDAVVHS